MECAAVSSSDKHNLTGTSFGCTAKSGSVGRGIKQANEESLKHAEPPRAEVWGLLNPQRRRNTPNTTQNAERGVRMWRGDGGAETPNNGKRAHER